MTEGVESSRCAVFIIRRQFIFFIKGIYAVACEQRIFFYN